MADYHFYPYLMYFRKSSSTKKDPEYSKLQDVPLVDPVSHRKLGYTMLDLFGIITNGMTNRFVGKPEKGGYYFKLPTLPKEMKLTAEKDRLYNGFTLGGRAGGGDEIYTQNEEGATKVFTVDSDHIMVSKVYFILWAPKELTFCVLLVQGLSGRLASKELGNFVAYQLDQAMPDHKVELKLMQQGNLKEKVKHSALRNVVATKLHMPNDKVQEHLNFELVPGRSVKMEVTLSEVDYYQEQIYNLYDRRKPIVNLLEQDWAEKLGVKPPGERKISVENNYAKEGLPEQVVEATINVVYKATRAQISGDHDKDPTQEDIANYALQLLIRVKDLLLSEGEL